MKNIIINLLLILIFGCTFTEDTTKTAEKTDILEQTYTVTYKSDYGTVPSKITGLKKGDKLTDEQLPELTTDGYTFAGWYNGETKVEAGYTIISNLELAAKWGIMTDYVVKAIEALSGKGPHDITVTCTITSDTILAIQAALKNNSNAKVNLDLSRTTGLISIGNYAFYYCNSLEGVVLPNSVTSIDEGVFYECSNLESVTIPDSVTSIGNYAFYDCCSLTSVTIGNSVTSIGNYAFYECSNLESMTIGDGVTSIGNYAFYDCCSLTSVTIGSSVTSIGNAAFYECSNLTSVIIPGNVTSIGEGGFSGCSSLESVTISDSVTSIGNYAFSECSNLESMTIPDGVVSIGNDMFSECSSLESVIIGDNVTSIGNAAFYDCRNLTTVNYKGTQEQWEQISIGENNEYLTDAVINYNYIGD
jgi:uncharacterized repeat protein (TIGR02543 family)